MQALFSIISVTILLHGMLLQTVWLYLGRVARDRYLNDIMSFRSPSSSLSRYYHWRVNSFLNALIEGALFLIILVGSIITLSTILFSFKSLLASSFVMVFIVFLSFISAMQHAWRVKEVVDSESRIVASVGYSKDKIGTTRIMVEDLFMQGPMGDGRIWFALFRLAQRSDAIGWAIRDVLIEKGKEEDARFRRSNTDSRSLSGAGPGIDS
ncbi:MAG: hypothetical protein ACFFDV_11320 [Candidatus Thorarchaeota archaeon]